jgi:hypothetical protein
MVKHIQWELVSREDVQHAIAEYDNLGATDFFAAHGYAPTTTYQLVEGDRFYPPKAILGTAYEFATGERLAPTDFEGGKSGAVRILSKLGYDVRERARKDGS